MATYGLQQAAEELAMTLARGEYQRGLISGEQNWSGSDLKGRAKNWSSKYWRSREALMQRMRDHGLRIERCGGDLFIAL